MHPQWSNLLEEISKNVVNQQLEIVALKDQSRVQGEGDQQRYAAFLLGVLEVLDLCERLIQQEESPSLKRVIRKLERVIKDEGVKEIKVDSLDPHQCRVVETRMDPNLPEGAILSVVRRGYIKGNIIIRLMDVVSNKF
jgi:molecular chaperone GrpE (heat shock protein)